MILQLTELNNRQSDIKQYIPTTLSSDSRTTIPAGQAQAENDPLQFDPSNRRIKAVNHALIARPWFINQVWGPVSLVSKDTEVRSYRTDPVQVRS
nr:hypothetical protein CFP56_48519 [Quercus suber]